MPSIRIPATILTTGISHTAAATFGGAQLQLILDTGSSVLAVDGGYYNPTTDPTATTTKLLQVVQYGSASFVGAVVQTTVSFPGAPPLPGTNLAVTYGGRKQSFDSAQGIIGLAYQCLDSATLMPADTWQNPYNADQISLGQPADLTPYLDQLATQGLAPLMFALALRRSMPSAALADPATDPLNQGLFILGGGIDCTDLYQAPLTTIAVVHAQFYNTNLLSVQVGTQPAINVPPVAPGRTAASNSIIDSGTNCLKLDHSLYTQVIATFSAINPEFATTLQQYAFTQGAACAQSTLNLPAWPPLLLTFQGPNGTQSTITIHPNHYWQFDAQGAGQAIAMICDDRGSGGGQSVLGLPIFTGYFVVFDRTASTGHGTIGFAPYK